MRALLVTVVVLLLLASGCSDSDDSTSTDTGADTEVSATTAAGSATSVASSDTSAPPETASGTSAPAATASSLEFTVEGVTGGGNIPIEFTCDGANETPAVTIEGVPPDVEELALIVDDPDAPTDSPFVHWVVYGIDPATSTVTDGDGALSYGVNDAGTDAWFGPCPPPGDGLHTYRWKLFGLSAGTDLEPGLDGRAVEEAIADTVVTEGLLIASYERAR